MTDFIIDPRAKKYGKYDMERIGLFSEMPYMIDDKYTQPDRLGGTRDLKKSQMYPGILKTKTGLQDAYFDSSFKRLFEKEGWKASALNSNARDKAKNNTSARRFIYSGSTKRHSTPGDYFGTFGPKLPAMSTAEKPLPKREKLLPNIKTAPTNVRGPGYADIGLSPYPEYKSSPYDVPKKTENKTNKKAPFLINGTSGFFDKNPFVDDSNLPTYKKSSKQKNAEKPFLPTSSIKNFGNGFDIWPKHLTDPYIDPHKIGNDTKKNNKDEAKFYPQTRNKSFYTTSIMQRKLKSAVNNNNWRTAKSITYNSI